MHKRYRRQIRDKTSIPESYYKDQKPVPLESSLTTCSTGARSEFLIILPVQLALPVNTSDELRLSDIISMSYREMTRAQVLQSLIDKRLKQSESAGMLDISVSHIKWLLGAYLKANPMAQISKRSKLNNGRGRERDSEIYTRLASRPLLHALVSHRLGYSF